MFNYSHHNIKNAPPNLSVAPKIGLVMTSNVNCYFAVMIRNLHSHSLLTLPQYRDYVTEIYTLQISHISPIHRQCTAGILR